MKLEILKIENQNTLQRLLQVIFTLQCSVDCVVLPETNFNHMQTFLVKRMSEVKRKEFSVELQKLTRYAEKCWFRVSFKFVFLRHFLIRFTQC